MQRAMPPASDPESRLKELGLELPPAPKPFASYRAAVRAGNVLYVAGTGPTREGKILVQGKVGEGVTVAQAYDAARLSCLNALAAARAHLGSLAKVRQVVQATVWIACSPAFHEHPKVADGATDLLRDVFGERGLPARAAVGAPSLPMDIPVEVALVLEVD